MNEIRIKIKISLNYHLHIETVALFEYLMGAYWISRQIQGKQTLTYQLVLHRVFLRLLNYISHENEPSFWFILRISFNNFFPKFALQ